MWDNYRKVVLSLVIWREASGEGREGMRAVAHVIWNRHLAGAADIVTVVAAKNQFSSMTVAGDGQTVRWPSYPDASFELAMALAESVAAQGDVDITGGATFYRNPQTATSKWFDENVANGNLVKTVSIGHHDFYKGKK